MTPFSDLKFTGQTSPSLHQHPLQSQAMSKYQDEEFQLHNDSPRFSLEDLTDDDDDEEDIHAIKLQELSSLLRPKPAQPQDLRQNDSQVHIAAPVAFEEHRSQFQWASLRPTRPFFRRRRKEYPWRRPYMPMSGGEGRNRCYCYYKLCILVVVACTVLFAAITADRSLEGGTWPKWDEVRNIYVFGDSYSTFGQREDGSTSVVQHLGKNAPSADSSAIWNWIDYLAMQSNKSVVSVYDYSANTDGTTVSGVSEQVNQFIPSVNHAPWKRNSTLFITWIGIQDIIQNLDVETQLTQLFDLQEQLYAVGARNFLLLNIPPFDRAPGTETAKTLVIDTWNTMLLLYAKDFQERHLNDGTVIKIYNANLYFNKVLDDPKGVGFDDAVGECDTGECIWTDDFYPSSFMHKLLAKNLAEFLI